MFIPCFSESVFQACGFLGPGFSGPVPGFRSSPKVDHHLNFSLLRHDIYVYNFSSLSINVRKYLHQT